MATYVTLYRFTDQGMRNVKKSPDRLAAAIDEGSKVGVNVVSAYYTQGPYDLVVVTEADDEETAAAFALATASQGNVTSTTMRAWDADGFRRLTEMMP
ncbi:MAG: GYD domain-containing protein [Gemmatimonadota bacterium]|jgi:uncharacterized protein with GYD domain